MVNNKFIERAVKEINHAIEWETLEKQNNEIRFWLELAINKGRISALKARVNTKTI